MDFWGIAVGAAIASLAWIYQRAWEHQETRVRRYREFIDRLPAFTTSHLNASVMNDAITECRRLWLSAPDDVVRAYERLLDVVEGKVADLSESDRVVGECIVAMRRDATYWSALVPRFWRTTLRAEDFRIRTPKANLGVTVIDQRAATVNQPQETVHNESR